MLFPPAIAIAEQRLIDAGGEAFAVGGCVRDALLGRPCHDYDLTTNLPPARVIEAFAGYTVIPTGLRHGTVTVHIDGLPIDVTTYRIDGAYADGRHPAEVRFTGSLEDDLRPVSYTHLDVYKRQNLDRLLRGGGRTDMAHPILCGIPRHPIGGRNSVSDFSSTQPDAATAIRTRRSGTVKAKAPAPPRSAACLFGFTVRFAETRRRIVQIIRRMRVFSALSNSAGGKPTPRRCV